MKAHKIPRKSFLFTSVSLPVEVPNCFFPLGSLSGQVYYFYTTLEQSATWTTVPGTFSWVKGTNIHVITMWHRDASWLAQQGQDSGRRGRCLPKLHTWVDSLAPGSPALSPKVTQGHTSRKGPCQESNSGGLALTHSIILPL